MTNGFPGVGVSSAELFNTSVTGENSEKLMVPAGTYTFTLVKTGEDSYTLSYEEGGSNPIIIPGGGEDPSDPTNPDPSGTYTVKFTKPDGWGETLYCYYWTGTSAGPVDWPGSAMTFDSTNGFGQAVYAFEVPSSYEKIIFNDGNNQTPNITTSCSPMGYWLNGTTVETWDISGSGSGTGGGQQGGDDPQPSGTYTVRFTKPNGWNGANCYYWQTGNDGPIGWPGAEMTWETQNDYGEQVYKIDIPSNCNMIIFSDNGANQTSNITTSCSDCGYWLNNGVPTLW